MDLEIHVDRDRCMGSGQCVWQAPGVFDQDDDAISVVVDPRGEPEDKIVKAVTSCPVMAISLRIGGVDIGATDLWQWHSGVTTGDPLVELLVQLSAEHDRLRDAMAALRGGAADTAPVSELVEALSSHLSYEDEQIYPALVKLLGKGLVDAFDTDHHRMGAAVRRLSHPESGHEVAIAEVLELADVLDNHIRIEESVLFPIALGALHRASGAAPPPQVSPST